MTAPSHPSPRLKPQPKAASRPLTLWQRMRASAPPIPGFSPRDEDVVAHWVAHVPPFALLIASGLASALLYLVLVLAYPITRWWNHPRLAIEMGKLTDYSPVAAFGYIGVVLALFLCQFFALTAIRQLKNAGRGQSLDRLVKALVFGFPVVFAAIMLWMQPITTTDLYGYVARGYLFTHLHHNPMIVPAQKLPGGYLVDRPASPYGPMWLLIVSAVSRIGGENLLANMLMLKGIAIAAFLGTIVLIDQLVRRVAPERRLNVAVLFAWSPLLLFEAVGNGHNDIVMMFCIMAALLLMHMGWLRTALVFLVIGALLKYVALALVPLWLVYALRTKGRVAADSVPGRLKVWLIRSTETKRDWLRSLAGAIATVRLGWATWLVASSAVAAGLITAVTYAPFWAGMRTFTGLGAQLRPLYYNGSIVQFVAAPIELLVSPDKYSALDKSVRLAFYLIFLAYAVLQTLRLWRSLEEPGLMPVITAAAKLIFASLVLITFWFQPWYIVWLLPLSALTNDSFLRRAGVIFSAGALLTYAVSNFLPVGNSGVGRDLFVQFFEVLVTFAPLLLLRPASGGEGWGNISRRYAHRLAEGIQIKPRVWQGVTLGLILLVAALLRVLRLGDLFGTSDPGGALSQVSAQLKLFLTDPRGLHAPFIFLQSLFTAIFGDNPIAVLLPTAIIGTFTVYAIYLLTMEVTRQARPGGMAGVALIAALLAATSRWHVSLSRSGMEIVLLALVRVLSLYFLLLALRWQTEGRQRGMLIAVSIAGICAGLAMDITPGLWLSPLFIVAFLILWWVRQPKPIRSGSALVGTLGASTLVAGLPAIVGLVGQVAAVASHGLAEETRRGIAGLVSLTFWQHVGQNTLQVLKLFATQDYTASYPSPSGTPVVSVLIGWCFFAGIILLLATWRTYMSQTLLLLVALPLVTSISTGSPVGIILAAGVLPAMCIVPALLIYRAGEFFGHLPIVLDRVNGARVFTTPEQIGRVLLLVFLLIMTVRTFFWYFEAMLPSTPPNQWIPT
ncbi:MAG TPA: glycosyltransferase family 39 protein [Ktedonobacterales bacterium]